MNQEIKALIPPILGLGNDWTIFQKMMQTRFESQVPGQYSLPVSIVIPVYNRKEKLAKTKIHLRDLNLLCKKEDLEKDASSSS